MEVRKDLIRVSLASIVSILSGIIQGLLIPRFLNIIEYADFKTFTLLAGYVGILHFGFSDGLYIKYGGFNKKILKSSELKSNFIFLFFFQLIVFSGIFIFGIVYNYLFAYLALYGLPYNLLLGIKHIQRAIGEFKKFSLLTVSESILKISLFIFAIVSIQKLYSSYFIIILIVSQWLVFFLFWTRFFFNLTKETSKIKTSEIFNIFASGFFIMMGNLSYTLFYSIDRWFVKLLLTTKDFAYYSFAASMMNMIVTFVASISMTFYPILVHEKNNNKLIKKLKTFLIILGAFASTTYFLFKIVLHIYLPNYIPSLDIISVLFAGFPAIAVINAIYVNLYKAQKVEKKYFFTVVSMAAVSFLLNLLAVIINKSTVTIVVATTIAFYFWFFYSSKDFEGTETNIKEIVYLIFFLILFFNTTRLFIWWMGLFVFILGVLIITIIFYKREFFDLISKIFFLSKK
ncbi:polysaccharide biosynthesis protein [Thermosipho sp. 1063]|nr:polysaccharide biosynthesis protein [Thermosipho sp. 1063]